MLPRCAPKLPPGTAHLAFSRSREEGILLGGTSERKIQAEKLKRRASPYFSCLENKTSLSKHQPAGRSLSVSCLDIQS